MPTPNLTIEEENLAIDDMKNFEEQCECARDNFCNFVQHNQKYNQEQIDYLIEHSLGKDISKVFRVGYVLIVWSFIAVWIDNFLIPAAIGYSVVQGEASWVTAIPVIFLVVNATLKAIFIKYRLKKQIGWLGAYWSAVPYIGFAFLLQTQFKTDKLLYKAAKDYFLYQKVVIKREVRRFFGLKTKSEETELG
ncbi:hypothetical protein KMW28_06475 [Flammeovirga yaeyamensis]|uniref:Permease n=1 Tax=Flammeovirga yaeyamensis TaxID=367791 RepID=A0AAX1N703_9BACT|nr:MULTISPECIES: hypothetical protein [Flammeovirga]ANQ49319.1 hypothetical protein MY04_1945 [Flammeovirga sp. MY04]MBB3697818.1 hypothetical protein [Flammeovirga yaeyamensis]NMF35826.1 hypothetical protein [Flammeovirga yaeyamensis]QWG03222.1 hypothetical protein KMW28_06475 [Flammeovirga yaeyamensis]